MSLDANIGKVMCPCGSGKEFAACHGGQPLVITHSGMSMFPAMPQPWKTTAPPAPAPVIAPAPVTRKLDLAAGQRPREGFEGVDLWDGSRHVVDLSVYPWPFDDSSVLELNCSHYIEHIPMEYVNVNGTPVPTGWSSGQDALLKFFDECYRILVPGGWMFVQVPAHRSDRAFQDPTHRRFITPQTFLYLTKQWRDLNGLSHYKVACDFEVGVDPIVDQQLNLRDPRAAQFQMTFYWNVVIDWHAKLQSKKPVGPPP